MFVLEKHGGMYDCQAPRDTHLFMQLERRLNTLNVVVQTH